MHKKVTATGDTSVRAIYMSTKRVKRNQKKTNKMDQKAVRLSIKSEVQWRGATMMCCSTVFLSAFSHFDIIAHKARKKHCSYHTAIYKASLGLL